jgi:hypothetical protein
MESLVLHMWVEERRNNLLLSHRIGALEQIALNLETMLQGKIGTSAPSALAGPCAGDLSLCELPTSRALTSSLTSLQRLCDDRQAMADRAAVEVKAAEQRQAMADLVGSMQKRWRECVLSQNEHLSRTPDISLSMSTPDISMSHRSAERGLARSHGCGALKSNKLLASAALDDTSSEASERDVSQGDVVLQHVGRSDKRIQDASLVSFVQEKVFFYEGGAEDFETSTARVYLFRVGKLDQRVGVNFRTINKSDGAEDFDSAVEGRHFQSAQGVVYFEEGASLAFIEIMIPNDEFWEPIREFGVKMDGIVCGKGSIGCLDTCACIIIDDDAYPRKIARPPGLPVKAAEKVTAHPTLSSTETQCRLPACPARTLARTITRTN